MSGDAPWGASPLRRWGLPLGIVWAQLMLSAFAFERRLPEGVRSDPSGLLLVLLFSMPALSLALLLALRRLDRDPARRSPPGDAVVAWLLAALFAGHALVLAVVTGALGSLHPGLALIVGFLLLGLAGLLPGLPHRSPFGLVTPATRASATTWRAVHRELAVGAAISGGLALASALGPAALVSALALGPVLVTLVRGLRRAPEAAPDEGSGPPERSKAPNQEGPP